jgi:hypothetical protein
VSETFLFFVAVEIDHTALSGGFHENYTFVSENGRGPRVLRELHGQKNRGRNIKKQMKTVFFLHS